MKSSDLAPHLGDARDILEAGPAVNGISRGIGRIALGVAAAPTYLTRCLGPPQSRPARLVHRAGERLERHRRVKKGTDRAAGGDGFGDVHWEDFQIKSGMLRAACSILSTITWSPSTRKMM